MAAEMQKTFKLPLLPGNTCGEELLRRNFRKAQILGGPSASVEKGVGRRTGSNLPIDFDSSLVFSSTTGSPYAGGHHKRELTEQEQREQALATKVLRYYGYFTEPVPESAVERLRVRKVVICYFLEDGTISVSEPRQDNSGIAFQGTMVKRHQIPRPDGSGYITYEELAIGADINFYGRTYHLVDCDAFTREFMTQVGAEVPQPEEYPPDNYTAVRTKAKEKPQPTETLSTALNAHGMKVKLSGPEIRATKQFLANDRKVLRLGAVWDDRKTLYGTKHYFTLYYFLADDTIEVLELNENNSGRDPFPSFCRRRKMVKPREGNTTGGAAGEFYTDADLRIGATINIFGRDLLIHSYDTFTADHLQSKYGVSDHTPIQVAEPAKAAVARIPPPYNGYGDEIDSLGSWKSLEPKPPRKDESKFLQHGDNVVKFALRLENGIPTDEIRKFVLSCFLADDSIAIFEPVQRNSGIVGGKFLQRQKLKNPATGKNYIATDFYVGCHTQINGFPFLVYASDERSLSYMEHNASTFPKSDVNRIVSRLQAMLKSASSGLAEALQNADASGDGSLDFKAFTAILNQLNLPVTEQEVLSVLRYFDRTGDVYVSYGDFISRIMPEGSVIGKDPRPWEQLYAEVVDLESENAAVKVRVTEQQEKVATTTAAYAARAFLEAYASRRSLFHAEFRFIVDYTTDCKIGEKEFRTVVTQKLKLPLSETQITELCAKLFPQGSRRVDYEEFLRLMQGTSLLNHNLAQIRDRR